MMKSIYTPMSGALAQEKVLEIIANNLANMNTVGFKQDTVTFKLLEPEPNKNYSSPLPPAKFKVNFDDVMPLRGNEFSYVGVADVTKDMSQGPVVQTGNETDFMLEGDGMFAFNGPEGIRYSRNGSLHLSPEGALVSGLGHPVLGERGAIFLKSGKFEMNPKGEIYQNGQYVDRLQIFQFAEKSDLERVGDNYFFYGGPDSERKLMEHPGISQGQLEGSNVSAMKSLAAMIVAHRSYEAYQKTITNYDHMMDKSANSVGEIHA